MDYKVVAIAVTYGDRAHFCINTAEAAHFAGAQKVIIVANNTADHSKDLLKSYKQVHPYVELVENDFNAGSAGGFALGFSKALEIGADLIWLLDDDNAAEPDALTILIDHFDRLGGPRAEIPPTLCSVRMSATYHQYILAGMPPNLAYAPRGSSINFDFRQYFRRRNWVKRHSLDCIAQPLVEIPYGPWGGLLLHRATVQAVGLPDAAFVLYQDDVEYTLRITRAGGRLFLVRDSHIHDQERSWSERGSGPASLMTAGDETRLHYYIRNRALLDIEQTSNRWEKAILSVNSAFVLFYAALVAIRSRNLSSLKTVARAMKKGYHRDFTNAPQLR